jgi:succinate dehydrogenase/fumarate reductase flavoprotein subunit
MSDTKNLESEKMEWPYDIRYEEETEVSADVLIVGGGIAGCWAAISAAKKGLNVAIVEKGATIRSGSGGAGVDHWQHNCTNPGSKITPEELTEACQQIYGGYASGITRYLTCTESYDAMLDLENMGVKVRDTDDEFKGAEFRDEETKLLYAYEYENKYCTRIWGNNVKPCLHKELKRLGVNIYDRVMVTSLLNEGGVQGARVVGATGINSRTGEFYVFRAKSTILTSGSPERLWSFSTEHRGFASCFFDPNLTGDGYDIGWRAGAKYTMMEKTAPDSGGAGYPPYGVGNPDNTWFACSIVDANGKEVPWVDRDGRELKTVFERYLPCEGQKFFVMGGGLTETHFMLGVPHPAYHEHRGPGLIPDLADRIRNGEFTLPLYADLPSMPEHERRVIFGMMVAQEGKTLVPIYKNYSEAGFDPDKDLLQVPDYPTEAYVTPLWWHGIRGPGMPERRPGFCSGGGVIIDWDLKSSLDGLYSAGMNAMGGSEHSVAACTGRYVGRTAAEGAKNTQDPMVAASQVAQEKARVYAPVKRENGVNWKELNAGICRIMQDACGDEKNEEGLKIGLVRLSQLKEAEANEVRARNPHELMRSLECLSLLNVGEMTIHSSLARKASSFFLNFKRLDHPDVDPEEFNKFTTINLEDGEIKYGELSHNYHLEGSYAADYTENYEKHCALD